MSAHSVCGVGHILSPCRRNWDVMLHASLGEGCRWQLVVGGSKRSGWRVVSGQDRVWVQAGGTSGRAALQSKWAWLCDMCVTMWVFYVVA